MATGVAEVYSPSREHITEAAGTPPNSTLPAVEVSPAEDDDVPSFGPTERYAGSNFRSFCDGRILLGPEVARLAVTLVILLVPFALLAVFMFPHAPWPLVAAGSCCFASTLFFLVRAATTDPGVVARRTGPTPNLPVFLTVKLLRTPPETACCISSEGVETEVNTEADEFQARVKFCSTCARYRGPRTFHCSTCNACIDMYDHHCPWLGTCVGAFNYVHFLWFLVSLQGSLAVTFALCVVTPVLHSRATSSALTDALTALRYMPVLLMAYVCVLGLPASVLTIYHFYLVSTAQLTIEHLRRNWTESQPNPYDGGCATNMGRFCGRIHLVALADRFRELLVEWLRKLARKR